MYIPSVTRTSGPVRLRRPYVTRDAGDAEGPAPMASWGRRSSLLSRGTRSPDAPPSPGTLVTTTRRRRAGVEIGVAVVSDAELLLQDALRVPLERRGPPAVTQRHRRELVRPPVNSDVPRGRSDARRMPPDPRLDHHLDDLAALFRTAAVLRTVSVAAADTSSSVAGRGLARRVVGVARVLRRDGVRAAAERRGADRRLAGRRVHRRRRPPDYRPRRS